MTKQINSYKECPSCRSKIYRKNFRAEITRCKGGCGKLICKSCQIAGMCNECFMDENTVQISNEYYEDRYITINKRGASV